MQAEASVATDAHLAVSMADIDEVKLETSCTDPPTASALSLTYCPDAWESRFPALALSPDFSAPVSPLPGARQGKPPAPVKKELGRIGSQGWRGKSGKQLRSRHPQLPPMPARVPPLWGELRPD